MCPLSQQGCWLFYAPRRDSVIPAHAGIQIPVPPFAFLPSPLAGMPNCRYITPWKVERDSFGGREMTPKNGPDIVSTSKRDDTVRGVVFGIVLVLLCHVWGGRTWAEDIPMPASRMASSVAAKYTEMLRTTVRKVKEQGYVAVPDNYGLTSAIEELIKDKVLGLTAAQRQRLVKDTISAEDYSTLVQILVKQLGSADPARRESALRSLGCPRFALEATDQLKTFIFQKDRMTQWRALEALVCLDVPGANHLLDNLVLTGLLNDYDTARAIHVLYISNDADVDAMAMALLILEKSGQDLTYFTEMQKDSQLPAEKKHVLEKIVSRIQKGERLK
jgi:hypothetical protein